MLDDAWHNVQSEFPEAVRPEVAIGTPVAPTEVGTLRAQCLREAGFDGVRVSSDGGIESGMLPPSQAETYNIQLFVCTAKYPDDPTALAPLSEERLATLLAYYSSTLSPCLEAEGFDIPDAPSKETFVEGYAAGGAWSPYLFVQPSTSEEWERVNEICPERPENFLD